MTSLMSLRPLAAAVVGASACALAPTAFADPAPPFPALLAQARASAPRPAESLAQVAEAEARARQAATLPNPILSVEVENFAGSGPFRDTGAAETTASVAQVIELGGKRSERIAAGRAAVGAARAGAALSQADFAFDLAKAYVEAEASERRLEIVAETLRLAEEDSRIARALVDAGKEADIRSVQVRAALLSARAALDKARAARVEAFGRLTALSGSTASLTSIPVSLLAHAEQQEVAPQIDPMQSPAYRAAAAARDAAARQVRVERTRSVPDVTLSVGGRRFEADDASALVAGLSVPLPLFDRNRESITASRAALTAAEARLNAARLEALAQASSAITRFETSQTRLQAAQAGEDAAGEAARLARLGYEGGKLSLLELLTARRAYAEARAQTLEAQLARLNAEAALARLRGVDPFGDL